MIRASVVVPCWNAAPFVGETLESVLGQSHPDVEIIAVDDGSTDATWDVISSYGDRVRCERIAHAGVTRALNHGLARATGAHVMFLGADDVLTEDTLASLAAALDGAPPRSVATCRWRRLVRGGDGWRPVESGLPPVPRGDPLDAWLGGWFVPTCSLLWPRGLVLDLGGWDDDLISDTDGDLALRALIAGVALRPAARGEGLYRQQPHGQSVSTRASEAHLRSRMRVLDKAEAALRDRGLLERHAVALGRAYHRLARRMYALGHGPAARECAARADRVAGPRSITGSLAHRLACRLVGLDRKERLAETLASAGLRGRSRSA